MDLESIIMTNVKSFRCKENKRIEVVYVHLKDIQASFPQARNPKFSSGNVAALKSWWEVIEVY